MTHAETGTRYSMLTGEPYELSQDSGWTTDQYLLAEALDLEPMDRPQQKVRTKDNMPLVHVHLGGRNFAESKNGLAKKCEGCGLEYCVLCSGNRNRERFYQHTLEYCVEGNHEGFWEWTRAQETNNPSRAELVRLARENSLAGRDMNSAVSLWTQDRDKHRGLIQALREARRDWLSKVAIPAAKRRQPSTAESWILAHVRITRDPEDEITTTAIYEAAGEVLNREFMDRQFGSPRSFMHQVRQTLPDLPQAGRAWDGGKYVMGYTGVRLA